MGGVPENTETFHREIPVAIGPLLESESMKVFVLCCVEQNAGEREVVPLRMRS